MGSYYTYFLIFYLFKAMDGQMAMFAADFSMFQPRTYLYVKLNLSDCMFSKTNNCNYVFELIRTLSKQASEDPIH